MNINLAGKRIIANPAERIWLSLNMLDLALTIAILHLGGSESMPVARWLMSLGLGGSIAGRMFFTLAAAFVLLYMHERVLRVCNQAMFLIVCWNVVCLALSLR